METTVQISDWKTQTDVMVKGSELPHDVYQACYQLAEGAAAALRVAVPRAEVYASALEYALRRFVRQYHLSTGMEVMTHSQTVIDHVVTERMREKGIGFQPPF